jgi:hypothetical protein
MNEHLLYKFPAAIDYNRLIDHIEKKYDVNTRDFAGRHSKKNEKERKRMLENWLKENGYEGKHYVLDLPENSSSDWPDDSEEMKLRIEINTKRCSSANGYTDIPPYLDFWHWLLEEYEFHRGINSLCLIPEEDDNYPDWVKQILSMIYPEVKDNPAFDEVDGLLTLYVDW